MAGHKLWVETRDQQVDPSKFASLLIYEKPMSEIPNGPAGDPAVVIPLSDLIEAYNTVHGTDYTNY